MVADFEGQVFAYRRSVDQDLAQPPTHAVLVVGAGPVGLTLAIDLAQRGVPCVLLDDQLTLSSGSRAICFAKRTLEIFDRLGVGEEITASGVGWHVGKVFFGDHLLYQFDLAAEGGQHRPPFINLQQYVVEGFLTQRALALKAIDVRFGHRVCALRADADHIALEVDTPEGVYALRTRYLVACDGARSTVRALLGLSSEGRVFQDRFLIADVRMRAPFPTERWFWFDPPFHRQQSALLHRQPGDLWRLDFQLGWDADPEAEKAPERVRQRVAAMLGADIAFDLVWVSVYTFSCQRMDKFVHDQIVFAGDAAHGVSPFGARGANGGVQDADNLGWKLAAILQRRAPPALLATYDIERSYAADENILHSTRSTDFITPKSAVSRLFRDAVLRLARHYPFARRFVNSGRLSRPATLWCSPLNTEASSWVGGVAAGAPCEDAPLLLAGQRVWLLDLLGPEFTLLVFGDANAKRNAELSTRLPDAEACLRLKVQVLFALPAQADKMAPTASFLRVVDDVDGLLFARYAPPAGAAVLVRPDQHVVARLPRLDAASLFAALERALGQGLPQASMA